MTGISCVKDNRDVLCTYHRTKLTQARKDTFTRCCTCGTCLLGHGHKVLHQASSLLRRLLFHKKGDLLQRLIGLL